MSLSKLIFRAGQNTELTATQNEGGWSSMDLVRFFQGLPEKFKGWQNAGDAGKLFIGICRALRSWAQISGARNAVLGTHLKLEIFEGGLYSDITPVDLSGTEVNNPFTTTSGSALVTVAHVAHTRAATDYVIWSGAATFNNVTMNGEFQVVSVTDADHFVVTATTIANANGAGGGAAVLYTYLLSSGTGSSTPGLGWGSSTWGDGTWGTPRSVAATVLGPRLWSLDLVGEDLLACPRDGKIYTWDASTGVGTRAVVLTNAPLLNKFVLMSAPERHVVSLGAEIGGTQDPMLVRWTDTELFTVWTATATNAAGSFRLSDGSGIVAGRAGTQEHLIWTDTTLLAMRWTGSPYVFRFDKLGSGCGLIGPNAQVIYNGTAYWMDIDGFHVYRGGAPEQLPCPLHEAVFGNLNHLQLYKIFAGINATRREIIWFYPSANATENDSYIVYNYMEDLWYMGTGFQRTAWEEGDVFGYPIATHPSNGKMYYHEFGENDDGAAMPWFLESGDIDIDDGDQIMFVKEIIPDFRMPTGSCAITVKTRDEPNTAQTSKGPFTCTPTTKAITPRARGRQVALRIEGNTADMSWRLGALRARVQPDGKK